MNHRQFKKYAINVYLRKLRNIYIWPNFFPIKTESIIREGINCGFITDFNSCVDYYLHQYLYSHIIGDYYE